MIRLFPVFSQNEDGLKRDSATVVAAGYDPSTQVLAIQFRSTRAVYNYYEVPPLVWLRFRKAKSKGKFVRAILTYYEFQRVA